MSSTNYEALNGESNGAIEDEIHELEQKLERAKARLKATGCVPNGKGHDEPHVESPQVITQVHASMTKGESPLSEPLYHQD